MTIADYDVYEPIAWLDGERGTNLKNEKSLRVSWESNIGSTRTVASTIGLLNFPISLVFLNNYFS